MDTPEHLRTTKVNKQISDVSTGNSTDTQTQGAFANVEGHFILFYFIYFFKIIYLFIFRKRGKEGEREGMKHQYVVASHAPLLGTWPATQACVLTGN